MAAKFIRAVINLPEIPVRERSKSFANRTQLVHHITRYISREAIHNKYGISAVTSSSQLVDDLMAAGKLEVTRSNPPVRRYLPDRRGYFEVRFMPASKTPLKFVIKHRKDAYVALRTSLFPIYTPSDRAYRLHLMSMAHGGQALLTQTEETIIDHLILKGILSIEEKQYAPKTRPIR